MKSTFRGRPRKWWMKKCRDGDVRIMVIRRWINVSENKSKKGKGVGLFRRLDLTDRSRAGERRIQNTKNLTKVLNDIMVNALYYMKC